MSAPEHPNEFESNAIAQGLAAASELNELTPELHEGIMSQLKRVEGFMADNGGILDPNLAVQAWYQVMAEAKVYNRLKKIIKLGSNAADQHIRRVANAAAVKAAS